MNATKEPKAIKLTKTERRLLEGAASNHVGMMSATVYVTQGTDMKRGWLGANAILSLIAKGLADEMCRPANGPEGIYRAKINQAGRNAVEA